MWTYDQFEPGKELGNLTVTPSQTDLEDWAVLFPHSQNGTQLLPSGLIIAIMMRGYMHVLRERPPGNVHASQELIWGDPVGRGLELMVGLKCVSKEFKNERRWVWFENSVRSEHGLHLTGKMRMLWSK